MSEPQVHLSSQRSNGANGETSRIRLSTPAIFPTEYGRFAIRAIKDAEGREHVVISNGDPAGLENVPVRVHSECLTSEALHSMRCDCREQLQASLSLLGERGVGVVVYLRQEGRGIGLFNKIEAYALQDTGLDTVEANQELGFPIDSRTYEVAAYVLMELGVSSISLMTNNPMKIEALESLGIRVSERLSLGIEPGQHNDRYIKTKQFKLNHFV